MSATAALLGWIDPSRSTFATPITFGELQAVACAAVADLAAPAYEGWNKVEVSVAAAASDHLLSATRGGEGESEHFLIDETGRISRSDLWARQVASVGRPQAICIQLQAPSSQLSQEQRWALDAIVHAINAAGASDRRAQVPVYFVSSG